jgi:hypothetical protein
MWRFLRVHISGALQGALPNGLLFLRGNIMHTRGLAGSAITLCFLGSLAMIGATGCVPSGGGFVTVDAFDIRAIEYGKAEGKQDIRVVLGVEDFDGQFSERFRKSGATGEGLDPHTRTLWRKMGTIEFANDMAKHLGKHKTVLDVRRANIQTADLILRSRLDVFERDSKYDYFTVGNVITWFKWTIQSKIDAEFTLATPANEVLHTFKVKLEVPPQVTNKTQFLTSEMTGTPTEIDEAYGKVSRGFYQKLLNQVESEITACRGKFSDLERPDLDVAQGVSKPLLTGKPRSQWAVVIGISRYANAGTKFPDLQFADRDANEVCRFLMSPAGGEVPKDHIRLLTNAEAPGAAIRNALFTFLKDAEEDDLVIIFFSGHGTPDPTRPENLYLLPYDVDPGNIAATGFPMWDLEKVLYKTLRAQRVIVLADACHSGGVGAAAGERGIGLQEQADLYNRYYTRLGNTSPGRVILSSSAGDEVSREGSKWDRHGVFTWALLKGLQGEADGAGGKPKDGIISVFEVIQYVTKKVTDETKGEQHPLLATSPKYDHELPLGVVGASVSQQ